MLDTPDKPYATISASSFSICERVKTSRESIPDRVQVDPREFLMTLHSEDFCRHCIAEADTSEASISGTKHK